MKYYNKIVPFEVAKKLKDAGYPQLVGKGVYAENGQSIEGLVMPFISAPTYADAIDWLFTNGIFVQMEPWHTFALKERMGFVYELNSVDEENAKISSEVWNDFASFGLCADAAIERAIEKLKENKEE